jgi:hypothetical protein
MKQLREKVLVSKFFAYFVLPAVVLSFLGMYFPYVYAMLAVNESDMCICSYFINETDVDVHLFLNVKESY